MAPRTLLILRHAKSSWDQPHLDDHERPLSPRGRRAASAMAEWMAEHGPPVTHVLCSPAVRARQTWERVAPALGGRPGVTVHPDLYLAGVPALLQVIRAVSDEAEGVLVVGHNPGLHDLARGLAEGGERTAAGDRLREKLPTGGLVLLEPRVDRWRALDLGVCRLAGFVVPKDLPDARERGL